MNPRSERARLRLVRLLWLYFLLLIVEGALRKWVLPAYSDVLLIARDPVAVAILYLAVRDGFLPTKGPMRGLVVLFAGFVALGALQLSLDYFRSVPVLAFGLRTYFLHVPLIFIMAQVLDRRTLRRLTWVTLIVAIPIALLMVLQFESGPKEWINLGVGQAGRQIQSASGKIRPAGPFSYVTGPVWYFTLAFACLIASHVGRDRMPAAVRLIGWTTVLVVVAVSGSRALIVGLVPVLVCTLVALAMQPRLVSGVFQGVLTLVIAATLVWSFSVVQQGVGVLSVRISNSGGTQELIQRTSNTYDYAQTAWIEAPLLGQGLGLGTNAGSALIGKGAFQLGEDEWSRVIFEAGPVLGLAYLGWRIWLTLQLLRLSVRAASLNYVLPLALLGACASNLVMGQWGQPTTQGFAVWVAGMCLAGCRLTAVHASHDSRTTAEPALT